MLVASLIEEQDFTACLGETLFQAARRVDREPCSPRGRQFVDAVLEEIARAMRTIIPEGRPASSPVDLRARRQFLQSTRERSLQPDDDWPWPERGRILELLGSAERAFLLIDRIDIERASVPRVVPTQSETAAAPQPSGRLAPAVP
jgi:phosphate:Na+ symporter